MRISEQSPYIHREEFLDTDASVANNECRLGREKLFETIQSFGAFLGITLYFNSDDRTFLA